ncbi:MAG: cbb3-type cytochrome c oxidase subunit I [Caulobacterales bacterium]|nr:cbb3-type cytochrome c oxidase subunit I [Caulobacterales bacterium]
MTLSRSLLGRTSFLWAVGFVVLVITAGVVGTAARLGVPQMPGADTYYVVAHFHYLPSLGVTFLIFGGIYLALEQLRRGRHRRLLGGLHFAAMFAGALGIFAPVLLLGVTSMPHRFADPIGEFRIWNAISAGGYGLTLAAQVFFLAALIDALRPSPHIG